MAQQMAAKMAALQSPDQRRICRAAIFAAEFVWALTTEQYLESAQHVR